MAFRCGVVAVAGKPNVGKSTLVNYIVGRKVAIVAPRPQTTRGPIIGIANVSGAQILFHDTPGIHRPRTQLGKLMVGSAVQTVRDADAVLFVVDVSNLPDADDKTIAAILSEDSVRNVVALNKMDHLRPYHVEENYGAYEKLTQPAPMMMTNALTGDNVDKLLEVVVSRLPEAPSLFDDPDLYTTQTQRDMAAELIREQALLQTREEVPHGIAVYIDSWEEPAPEQERMVTRISAVIIVERKSHKPILIGHGGSMLKRIGTTARQEIERLLGRHVYLELFVKVMEGWRDSPARLRELGLVK